MSAKHLNDPAADCACGAKPCIHKRADAFGRHRHGYYLSCTRCRVQTELSESQAEAVADWNDAAVQPATLHLDFPVGAKSLPVETSGVPNSKQ